MFGSLFNLRSKRSTVTTTVPPLVMPSGTQIVIELRRSKRARRAAIRVLPGDPRVELVLPERFPVNAALSFLESRRPWLIDRLSGIEPAIPFVEGSIIPVLGRDRVLKTALKPRPGESLFHLDEDSVTVFGRPEHLARRTRAGLADLAGRLLRDRVNVLAREADRVVTRVSIGDPASRWGSCSSRGRLRFSWRLVLAPESVLNYVAAHEVAHLIHMDHSPAFWDVVAELCPTYETDRLWLKQNGARLMRYGAEGRGKPR